MQNANTNHFLMVQYIATHIAIAAHTGKSIVMLIWSTNLKLAMYVPACSSNYNANTLSALKFHSTTIDTYL